MMPPPGCQPLDHPRLDRRELLRVGGWGLLGASLADVLRLEAEGVGGGLPQQAQSVVFIYQAGGPSQHETFDPKPEAPAQFRGEYGVIQTPLAGVHFCEHLPRLAARADRFAMVRTMHHIAGPQFRNEHSSCMYLLHTGTTELPAGDTNASISQPRAGRLEWPSIGSLLSYAAPAGPASGWPAVVELPRRNQMVYPGRGPGLLGAAYDRWGVDLAAPCHAKDAGGSCPHCFSHDDPNDPARAAGPGPQAWWDNSSCRRPDFRLPDLGHASVSLDEVENRAALLARLDHWRRARDSADRVGALDAWDAHRRRAAQVLLATRPGRTNPFDLSQEPDSVREAYGREEWGQGFLVARRLVEAGVRMAQVNLRGWDTHQNAFRDLKGKLLPSLDRCLAAFLDDLEARGLLERTLVVVCGEMGRTPRISPIAEGGINASGEKFTPGRHHWGDVFPCLVAGGGIRGGQVIGQSDRYGGSPVGEAYTPADLAATIFQQMGIDPHGEFRDAAGRAYRFSEGTPIAPLLSS